MVSETKHTDLLRKMESVGIPLKQYTGGAMYSGIKSGLNDAFLINDETRITLITADKNSAEIVKKFARGDDVRRWRIQDRRAYIIYTPPGIDIHKYPAIKKHLATYRSRLEARAVSQPWWELQQAQNRSGVWNSPKIVFPDIAREARFTFDESGWFLDMTAFIIPSIDLYLLGVLNSVSVWQYLSQVAAVIGDAEMGGRLRLKRQYIERIPIPRASTDERNAVATLVQKCLDAKGVGCEAWEQEINERVAALYGL